MPDPPAYDPEYGQLLREQREAAGHPQSEFAEAIGVHRAYLSDVELGKRLPLKVARTLRAATLLEIDPVPLMVLSARARGLDAKALQLLDDRVLVAVLRRIAANGQETTS